MTPTDLLTASIAAFFEHVHVQIQALVGGDLGIECPAQCALQSSGPLRLGYPKTL